MSHEPNPAQHSELFVAKSGDAAVAIEQSVGEDGVVFRTDELTPGTVHIQGFIGETDPAAIERLRAAVARSALGAPAAANDDKE